MSLLSSGDVGIGTSNPQAKLHLDTGAGGLPKIRLQHSSSGNDVFEITGGLAGVSNGGFGIYDVDETTYRLAIDSSGNVGIGTTSPNTKLHIFAPPLNTATLTTTNCLQLGLWVKPDGTGSNTSGDIYTGITLADGFAGMYGVDAGASAANHLAFFTGNNSAVAERMRIDSSGRLLVGTTTEGFATYGDKFTIANSGHCGTIRSGTSHYGTIYFSDGNDGSAAEVRGYLEYNHDNNALSLGTDGDRLRILSDGKVGIGTSTPSEKLHVNGDVLIDGAAGGTLTLGGSAAHTSKIVIGDNNGTGNGNLLIEGADGTDFITISSGGNVEIHDGNLKFASGHGIDFSVTSDATGSTSEKFDDYEEGTFTPDWQGTVTGGTTTTGQNHGSYTKIGNTVHIRIYSTITGTTATGSWIMHNLPFIGVGSYAGITTGSCMLNYLNWHANSSYVVPYKNSNTNDFDLYACGDSDAWRVIQIADDSAFEIILGLTYQAA